MRSHVGYWLNRIDEVKIDRLKASGTILSNNIKDSIRDQGLVDSSRMINDIQCQPEEPENEVRVGSTIDNPPYPRFLNGGFTHHITEEIVGPYLFMQKGTSASEGPLRTLWRQPMRT